MTNIKNIHQNKKRASKPSAGYKIDNLLDDKVDNYIIEKYIKEYRTLYENEIGSIPKNWDIHHIDFNHDNNDIENLIAVPKIVHVIIHKCGLCSREEIERMIDIYKITNKMQRGNTIIRLISTLDENDLDSNDGAQSIHIS